MVKLSNLQQWCVLMSQKDSGGLPAGEVIADTRVLIVERLFPRNVKRTLEAQKAQSFADGVKAGVKAGVEAAAKVARDTMCDQEWPPQDGDRQINEVMAAIRAIDQATIRPEQMR